MCPLYCSVWSGCEQLETGTVPVVIAVAPNRTDLSPGQESNLRLLRVSSGCTDGSFDEKEVVEDIPRALVLMPESANRDSVVQAATGFGYRVEQALTPEEAIEKMRFVNYAAVFLHDHFEPGGIVSGKFHQFMRVMNMSRRRYIFYVLLGEQFQTLYDLQALAYSVNLVVNDAEIPFIGTVLKKAIPEFETLFGPLMEELQVVGK